MHDLCIYEITPQLWWQYTYMKSQCSVTDGGSTREPFIFADLGNPLLIHFRSAGAGVVPFHRPLPSFQRSLQTIVNPHLKSVALMWQYRLFPTVTPSTSSEHRYCPLLSTSKSPTLDLTLIENAHTSTPIQSYLENVEGWKEKGLIFQP